MKSLDSYNLSVLSLEEMQEIDGGTVPGSTTAEKAGYLIGHATAAVVNFAFTYLIPWNA